MIHEFHNIKILEQQGKINLLACGERYGQLWFLKGLKPEFAQKKLYQDLLRKEFDIAMQLHHPNIVGVVSLERVDQLGLCIIEEWIEGKTLQQWLKAKHTVKEKLEIFCSLLAAVEHCHSLQVIHRDLKPSNIMIPYGTSQVKIIDFGLSDTDRYSSLKAAAGTINYVAPEVLEKNIEINAQADIYSLGKILKDLDLPKCYNNVVLKATAANRDVRYSNVSQLQGALNEVTSKSQQKRMLTIAALAVLAISAIAFVVGYNIKTQKFKSQLASTSQIGLIPGWQRGDSIALARDTSLMVIDVPEKGFSVFMPNPGTDKMPYHIPESEAVDLGLSVDWAPFNVGAESSNLMMTGAMFNGGMGNPFTLLAGYCFGDHSRYRIESFEGTRFDAAHKLWEGRWRMPIVEDFKELLEMCQWKFVDEQGTIPGYLVTGPNGNSIFFPFAGFRYDRRYFSIGDTGYYWTATRTQPKEKGTFGVIAFIITDDMIFFQPQGVLNGFSIRPVLDKKTHKINDFYNQPSENEPNEPRQ